MSSNNHRHRQRGEMVTSGDSCSDDLFSPSTDLLCCEDSSEIFSGEFSTTSSEEWIEEESIAGYIEGEREFVPGGDYLSRFLSSSLEASAREHSVSWILKPFVVLATKILRNTDAARTVQAYYGFQPLTAYLSVNYLDRFLYSRRLPQTIGWPLQLLSVACLSLAAKMEEPLVPSILDFQVEGAKYIFEPRTITRMELLVLSVLDWRLRSITPFSFIGFFACKLDPTGMFTGFLISQATEIILSNIKEASFLEYWPSSIAAAAILCAANELPNLSLVSPEHAESWCDGLSKEKIIGCYQLMRDQVLQSNQRKQPKAFPPLRVTIRARMRSSDSSSSSSFSSCRKRRKLDKCLWTDDDN